MLFVRMEYATTTQPYTSTEHPYSTMGKWDNFRSNINCAGFMWNFGSEERKIDAETNFILIIPNAKKKSIFKPSTSFQPGKVTESQVIVCKIYIYLKNKIKFKFYITHADATLFGYFAIHSSSTKRLDWIVELDGSWLNAADVML